MMKPSYQEHCGCGLRQPDGHVVAEGDDVPLSPALLESLLALPRSRHHPCPPQPVDLDVAVRDEADVAEVVEIVDTPGQVCMRSLTQRARELLGKEVEVLVEEGLLPAHAGVVPPDAQEVRGPQQHPAAQYRAG